MLKPSFDQKGCVMCLKENAARRMNTLSYKALACLVWVGLSGICVLGNAPARAQEKKYCWECAFFPRGDFYRELGQRKPYRHEDIFLQVSYGVSAFRSPLGPGSRVEGLAMEEHFQLGGAGYIENLVFHADFGIVHSITTDFDPDSARPARGYDPDANVYPVRRLMLSEFGGGLTYYFMPHNIYLGSSLLLVGSQGNTAFFQSGGYGLGVKAMVGKEWWVGEEFAIGCGINAMKVLDVGQSFTDRFRGFRVGLMFTATFN